MIKGIPAGRGFGIGAAVLYYETEDFCRFAGTRITEAEIETELNRYGEAVEVAFKRLEGVKAKADQVLGAKEALMFEAYKMVLHDPLFQEMVETNIKVQLLSTEAAVLEAVAKIQALFLALDNEYMKQRAEDVENVGGNLLEALSGVARPDLSCLDRDVILIAKDLTPADTVSLDRVHIKGFAIEKGGVTSHTAIVARNLEIPAVVGCGEQLRDIAVGQTVILDGIAGTVLINPDGALLAAYQEKQRRYTSQVQELKQLKSEPAVTRDGVQVELVGNIAQPQDALRVIENGGSGIGLFRTEFLFLDGAQLPTEEEQFQAYRQVAGMMGGRPCIIRTLDVGGDKQPKNIAIPEETNPFLGYRAIRICLNEPVIFKTQLRAILRASAFGNLRIMFPMITGLEELRAAKQMLAEVRQELADQAIPFDPELKTGIMIETPAAAMIADLLAREADFFSIGANDLCQYTLAVDRLNEKVSYLYQPLHPGVLRLIRRVIDAGHQAGIKVGMCGEMAASPESALILLGLGLDEFSMNPAAIPYVKQAIRTVTFQAAAAIANHVMTLSDPDLILAYLKEQCDVD